MNWKSWVPLVLAIVLGVIAAKVARDAITRHRAVATPQEKFTRIVVARGDVEPGRELSADDLTLAQESVGLCDQCIKEAAAGDTDQAWLDENVGARMFDLHDVDETYILDAADRPIYASVRRELAAPETFARVVGHWRCPARKSRGSGSPPQDRGAS